MTYPRPDRLRVSQIVKACCMEKIEFVSWMLNPPEPTDSMIRGTVFHSLILENKLPDNIASMPFADFRSKKARDAKTQAVNAGMLPVKSALLAHWPTVIDPDLRAEFSGYEVERPFFGMLEGFGAVQGKVDAWHPSRPLADLKTTEAQFFKNLHSNIYKFGYDLQMYLYMKLSRAESAVLYIMDCITGCWTTVSLELEEIEFQCQTRLIRGIDNLQAWNDYKTGNRKHIEGVAYAPPQWAMNDLTAIEQLLEEEEYEPDTTSTDAEAA